MINIGRLEIISIFTSLILHTLLVSGALIWKNYDKKSTRLISVKVVDVAATKSPNQNSAKQENDDKKNSDLKITIKDDGKFLKQSKDQTKAQKQKSEAQLTSGNFAKNSSKINSGISRKTDVTWLKSPTPIYPPKARMMGWQGNILLNVVMTKTGKVKEAKIIKSTGHQLLDDAALQAIWLWEIAPDSNDLEGADFEVPIIFKLENDW